MPDRGALEGEGAERLYARADAALYAAKQAGRNRVQQG
ncbi:PleD family two-component response regulator [Acidovorax soli]|uniref:PleD family two-component response regulator n=1 Tax=Acidovorax soli TaxID=592050 RepID=A0A7X0PBV4_9BURK|nr:PleD family two-component response regulator [Acidovorax soli]